MKPDHAGRAISVVWVLCLILATAAAPAPAAPAEPRPMGAWFYQYQVITLSNEVVWPLDLYADVRYSFVDFAKLDRYSAVLVGNGSAKPMTAEQAGKLERWVAGGGLLVITGDEGRSLFAKADPFGPTSPDWTTAPCPQPQIVAARHPLMKGVDAERLAALVDKTALIKPASGEILAGDEKTALVWMQRHRRGTILYLGGALTPLKPFPPAPECQILYELNAAAVRLWQNLIEHFDLPRRRAVIAGWAEASRPPALSFWSRHQKQQPIGAALYYPPYPMGEDLVQRVRFDLGHGERDWQSLYVTVARDVGELHVACSDLKGEGGRLSAAHVRFFAQLPPPMAPVMRNEPPVPGTTKAPYWLVDLESLPPVGQVAVTTKRHSTVTFWIEVASDTDTPAGEYRGVITFSGKSGPVAEIPLHVRVWPLNAPSPELMNFELEHLWTSMPGGNFLATDAYRRNDALFKRCLRQLGELGVNFGQCYGSITKYGSRYARLRRDGRSLPKAAEEDPGLFAGPDLPDLEFSDYDDLYFSPAIEAGLTHFSTYCSLGREDVAMWAARTIDPDAAPFSSEHRRFQAWYWSQWARYLKERGYWEVYCKIEDELGPDRVEAWLDTARIIREAGFRTYTTAYNFMYTRETAAAADPWLDFWQCESPVRPYPEIARDLFGLEIDPTDIFWTTYASSVWGNYKDYGHGAGWATAFIGMSGTHVHGYLRWKWNDIQGAMVGPDRLFNAVSVISYARSVNWGRYLASLRALIELARARGVESGDIVAEMNRTVSTQQDALVRLDVVPSVLARNQGAGDVPLVNIDRLDANPRHHEAAKVRILELIIRLRDRVGDIRPRVRYGDWILAEDGRPLCALSCSQDPAWLDGLASWFDARSGVSPPRVTGLKSERPVVVAAGTRQGDPALASWLDEQFPGQITPTYPRPGHYVIKRFEQSESDRLILVIGGDEEGVARGLTTLARLLVVENTW